MKTRIAVLAIVALLAAAIVEAADFDAYVYWVTPGTRKTIAWNPPANGADGYDLQIWRMESSRIVYQTTVLGSSQFAILWKTPGHYVAYIRAFKGPVASREYGEWKNTLDPTVGSVNGQPRAWVLLVPTP